MKEPFCSRVYVRAKTSITWEMVMYTVDALMIWVERKHCMHSRIRFAMRELQERKKHAKPRPTAVPVIKRSIG